MKINFCHSVLLIGLFFLKNTCAMRPSGKVAENMQLIPKNRQTRWTTFVKNRDEGSRIFSNPIESIDPVEAATRFQRSGYAQALNQCKESDVFLCSSLEDQGQLGFCLSKEVVALSDTIRLKEFSLSSIEKEAYKKPKIIKVPYALDVLKDAVSVLQEIIVNGGAPGEGVIDKVIVDKSIKQEILDSFNRLSNVTRVLGELRCRVNIQRDFLSKLKDMMDSSDQDIVNNATFHQLPKGYQDLLISDSMKMLLGDAILKAYYTADVINAKFPVSVSSDGKKIVYLNDDKASVEITVWNSIAKNYESDPIALNGGVCSYAVISPDGSKIIVANESGIRFLDTDEVITQNFSARFLPLSKNTIRFLMCNYNGSVLVARDQQDKVTVFHESGTSFIVPEPDAPGFNILSEVLINLSGNRVVALYEDVVTVCDSSHKSMLGTLDGSFKKVKISPDGSNMIFLSKDGKQMFCCDMTNVASGIKSYPMVGHQKKISSLAFSPDGNFVASVGDDGFILWNIKDGRKKIYGPSADATLLEAFDEVAFSHDGKRLLLYRNKLPNDLYVDNGRLVCYNIDKILHSHGGPLSPEFMSVVDSQIKKISGLSFSDDDQRIIFSGYPTLVQQLLNAEQVAILKKIEKCDLKQRRLIYQLAFAFQYGKPMKLKEGSTELATFKTLPEDIQKALYDWIGRPKDDPAMLNRMGIYGRRYNAIGQVQESY